MQCIYVLVDLCGLKEQVGSSIEITKGGLKPYFINETMYIRPEQSLSRVRLFETP